MPRAQDGIEYYHTYPELIRQTLEAGAAEWRTHLYNRSRHGGDIALLSALCGADTAYFGIPEEEMIVIQCGIVDCAPRPLPKHLRKQVARLPRALRERVISFLHDHRAAILRMLRRPIRRTAPGEFDSMLAAWIAGLRGTSRRVYVINIAPTTERVERHSPGLTESIQTYNMIISNAIRNEGETNVQLINAYEALLDGDFASPRLIRADGQHLTAEAHELYARMILVRELRS